MIVCVAYFRNRPQGVFVEEPQEAERPGKAFEDSFICFVHQKWATVAQARDYSGAEEPCTRPGLTPGKPLGTAGFLIACFSAREAVIYLAHLVRSVFIAVFGMFSSFPCVFLFWSQFSLACTTTNLAYSSCRTSNIARKAFSRPGKNL